MVCYSVYLSIGGNPHRTASDFILGWVFIVFIQGRKFYRRIRFCLFSVRFFLLCVFVFIQGRKFYRRIRFCLFSVWFFLLCVFIYMQGWNFTVGFDLFHIVGDSVLSGFLCCLWANPPRTVGVSFHWRIVVWFYTFLIVCFLNSVGRQ